MLKLQWQYFPFVHQMQISMRNVQRTCMLTENISLSPYTCNLSGLWRPLGNNSVLCDPMFLWIYFSSPLGLCEASWHCHVKASNCTVSYILLTSLIFSLFSLLCHPNSATFIWKQIVFGVVFTVVVSIVLSKTLTMVMVFKVTTPGKWMQWFLLSGKHLTISFLYAASFKLFSVQFGWEHPLILLRLMHTLSTATIPLCITRAQLLASTLS